jgi:hypothetical protein
MPISGKCGENFMARLKWYANLFGTHSCRERYWGGRYLEPSIMSYLRPEERRQSHRRHYRVAKIEFEAGIHARGCHLIEISDSGVRLHLKGLHIPDEFVLLTSGNGIVRENTYKVTSRRGHQVSAKFVGILRSGFALQN